MRASGEVLILRGSGLSVGYGRRTSRKLLWAALGEPEPGTVVAVIRSGRTSALPRGIRSWRLLTHRTNHTAHENYLGFVKDGRDACKGRSLSMSKNTATRKSGYFLAWHP